MHTRQITFAVSFLMLVAASADAQTVVSVEGVSEKALPAKKIKPIQKYTIALVWQDAWLYASTSPSSNRVRAGEATIPRQVHPMVVVGQTKEWVRVQSVSAFETPHRLPYCPLSGFADLNVEMVVRKADVASFIASETLPLRGPYHQELIRDPCLQGLARLGLLPKTLKPAEQPKPTGIISPLVRHLRANTVLMWRDGTPAGNVRYDRPLPLNIDLYGQLSCFDVQLGRGVISLGPRDESTLSVCAQTKEVRGP